MLELQSRSVSVPVVIPHALPMSLWLLTLTSTYPLFTFIVVFLFPSSQDDLTETRFLDSLSYDESCLSKHVVLYAQFLFHDLMLLNTKPHSTDMQPRIRMIITSAVKCYATYSCTSGLIQLTKMITVGK